ncbi:MAG: hypothetical protein KDB69_09985, partial [Acidimicrobiia bacterium]|nr:hypothetical protein [Acidimicrobiia bacterium]
MRAVVAAVLSALIPGAGQLFARRPVRAALFFLPTAVVAVGLILFVDRGTIGMADLLVRPSFLTGLLVVDVLILGWRVAAVVDAFVISSTPGERGWLAVPVTLLLLFVAVPHVVAWDYGTRSISALTTTFQPSNPTDAQRLIVTPRLDPTRFWVANPADDGITRTVYDPDGPAAAHRPGLGDPDAVQVWHDIINTEIKPAPYAPA